MTNEIITISEESGFYKELCDFYYHLVTQEEARTWHIMCQTHQHLSYDTRSKIFFNRVNRILIEKYGLSYNNYNDEWYVVDRDKAMLIRMSM